jgi:hypothetical protein
MKPILAQTRASVAADCLVPTAAPKGFAAQWLESSRVFLNEAAL